MKAFKSEAKKLKRRSCLPGKNIPQSFNSNCIKAYSIINDYERVKIDINIFVHVLGNRKLNRYEITA